VAFADRPTWHTCEFRLENVSGPVRRQPRRVRTITADNGTEFHSDKALEARVPLQFSFATPHHS